MPQGNVNVEMKSMNSLVQVLQFQFNGAPISLIQMLMLDAAEELASACVATLDIELEGDPNVNDYDFSHCIPEGLEVAGVEAVIVCGECLLPYEKCDKCPNGWQLSSPTCITLKPCPPEKFQICVSLRPTEMCNALPDCFARHRRFFRHYVAGELSLMENEEWGSRSGARYHTRKAQGIKSSAAMRERRGHSSANRTNDGAGCLIA